MKQLISRINMLVLIAFLFIGCESSAPASQPSPILPSPKLNAPASQPSSTLPSPPPSGWRTPAIVGFNRNGNGIRVKVALTHNDGPSEIKVTARDDHGNNYSGTRAITGGFDRLLSFGYIMPTGFKYAVSIDIIMPAQAPLVGLTIVERYQNPVNSTFPISNGQPTITQLGRVSDLNQSLPMVLSVGQWVKIRPFLELRLSSPPQVSGDSSVMMVFEARNTDYGPVVLKPWVVLGQSHDGTLREPSFALGSNDFQMFCAGNISHYRDCSVPAQGNKAFTIRWNFPYGGAASLGSAYVASDFQGGSHAPAGYPDPFIVFIP